MKCVNQLVEIFFLNDIKQLQIILLKNQQTNQYHHLTGKSLPNDWDPSLNFTAARLLYQHFFQKEINNYEDYYQVFKNDFQNFSNLLKMVNQSIAIMRHNQGKIYFLNSQIQFTPHEQLLQPNKTLKINHKEVQNHYLVSQQVKDSFQNYNLSQFIQNYFSKPFIKFAILNAKDEEQIFNNVFEALCQGIFQGENEIWHTYKLYKNEFPIDPNQYKGIVISGSQQSAYDQKIKWIQDSRQFLRKLIMDQAYTPKIVGICWGHQVIAHACDGKCEKMNIPFVKRREKTAFFKEILNLNCFTQSLHLDQIQQNNLYFVESHGDHVTQLPQGATVLAKSDTANINMYSMKNNRIIGVQFHPEYNWTIVYMAVKFQNKPLKEEQNLLNKISETFQHSPQSNRIINEVLENFLKSD